MKPDKDVQEIAEIRERTMQAENGGNASFFTSACTEDIVVMPPGMPAVVGLPAAVSFMRAFLGQFDLQIQYRSEETQVDGNVAYDRGTYSQTLTPRGGSDGIPENGKFLWLYRRSPNGDWKMSRVMWNASDAPAGQA